MRMNRVQFQEGLSMTQFVAQYGTGFEATRLPSAIRSPAIHLLSSTTTNMAALQLKRHLEVRYRTVRRLKHKVTGALMQRKERIRFNAFAQVSEACSGGGRHRGKPRYGSENKQTLVIAVATDANLHHPGCAVIEPVRTFDNEAVSDWKRIVGKSFLSTVPDDRGLSMTTWIVGLLYLLTFFVLSTCLFFFVVTRGALVLRGWSAGAPNEKSHVYPIYSDMWLIKLVDFQPVISAILLLQYRTLVSRIVSELRQLDLHGKGLLITSCAFGNVIPRVVKAATQVGVERVLVADLIHNELMHARSKVGDLNGRVHYIEDNATAMQQPGGIVAVNVMFFLLHELPHHLKLKALNEAGRMLAPGGKLLLAEFHRPDVWVLRAMSWMYFTVFEPLGLALWSTHDPLACLEKMGGWTCERSTFFFGNFQVIVATKQLASGRHDGLCKPSPEPFLREATNFPS
ncbi:MAG: methyltransferase domain-containing protein [Rhodanobacter sp.]|nr:MAG: methyltransferase domain-containing protein [Rhodanobacter sp.]TAM42162.1 MAG: methyltransferase domain-containing protein [Rhodanobacter sp.]TAN26763.1 MAG: methyltransferase domain-containing protein [Rhodanobacter sp.]